MLQILPTPPPPLPCGLLLCVHLLSLLYRFPHSFPRCNTTPGTNSPLHPSAAATPSHPDHRTARGAWSRLRTAQQWESLDADLNTHSSRSTISVDMAYGYRNSQGPPEEPQFSNFSSNPISPPRNPNRHSGSAMPSNDARVSLSRRFTTNGLPTLSPIAQQRVQAAGGDTAAVSRTLSSLDQNCTAGEVGFVKRSDEGNPKLFKSRPSRTPSKLETTRDMVSPVHGRVKSCWDAIEDKTLFRMDGTSPASFVLS